jgi:hypothetical protein
METHLLNQELDSLRQQLAEAQQQRQTEFAKLTEVSRANCALQRQLAEANARLSEAPSITVYELMNERAHRDAQLDKANERAEKAEAELLSGGHSLRLTGATVTRWKSERDQLKAELAKAKQRGQELERHIDQVGFYFAGTEHQHIADKAVAMLNGAVGVDGWLRQLRIQRDNLESELAKCREELSLRAPYITVAEANDMQDVLRTMAPTGRAFLASARELRDLLDKRDKELTKERAEREARWDCHGGPGTTQPSCDCCATCLMREIDIARKQCDDLQRKLAKLEGKYSAAMCQLAEAHQFGAPAHLNAQLAQWQAVAEERRKALEEVYRSPAFLTMDSTLSITAAMSVLPPTALLEALEKAWKAGADLAYSIGYNHSKWDSNAAWRASETCRMAMGEEGGR